MSNPNEPSQMIRPGISPEMLARAGVRRLSAPEAMEFCGLERSGLWLPYRTFEGKPVLDGARAYGRLRLDRPDDSRKYHQAHRTGVHAYLPPGLDAVTCGSDLFCIEGEFKALSLMEAGFAAIGVSGFFGFAPKDGEELVPELAEALARIKPGRILFCGDSDTALNYQFSIGALRFAQMVQPIPLFLPRIPVNGPGKGADDCRQVLNGAFADWWRERVSGAVAVKTDMDVASLAIDLFEREDAAIAALRDTARSQAEQRLVRLALALSSKPWIQERVLAFAEKKLGMRRRGLIHGMKMLAKAQKQGSEPTVVEAFYDPSRKCYWIANERNEMIEVNETSLDRHLRKAGYAADNEDCNVSQLEERLIEIQTRNDVVYAGPLAGHRVGPQEMCGHRVLVTRTARLPVPQEGECPTIEALLSGLLDDPAYDQITYLMGWLHVAYEALAEGKLRHGQALAIAGPRDCGKSLVQNLITEIFGGRAAKPYRYMCGATEFNGDLFGAEHLMIEDEVAFTDIRARRHFGARIKDFTVNTVQSCHAKNRQAISLKPFWRVSISLNNEPENLLILPPVDESLEDKIILFKAYNRPLPMPTSTLAEYQKLMATLIAELPAFLDLVVKFQIPERLKSRRFGITHFHHPELLMSLSEMSPEMRLLALIDAMMNERDETGEWRGTATELERVLFESKSGHEARRLLDWNNATGTYLGRLAKQMPNRVKQERTAQSRKWAITPAHWIFPDREQSSELVGECP